MLVERGSRGYFGPSGIRIRSAIRASVGASPGTRSACVSRHEVRGRRALVVGRRLTDEITIDERASELWGVGRTDAVSFADLFSPASTPPTASRVSAAFLAARAWFPDLTRSTSALWSRTRCDGSPAGVTATKPVPSDRTMFGVFLDATARKNAEEANELLAGEMSHRVKNLLAIAAGLTAITSRSCETTEEMALQLTVRLTALGAGPRPRASGARSTA